MKRSTGLAAVVWMAWSASPALAGPNEWRNIEQAKTCLKEYDDAGMEPFEEAGTAWGGNIYKNPALVDQAYKDGKISDACKAELEREIPLCQNDKYEKQYRARELAKDGKGWCIREALFGAFQSIQNDPERMKARKERKDAIEAALKKGDWDAARAAAATATQKKYVEDQIAKLQAEKAKKAAELAKVELPKAAKKDGALEKQIAAAYKSSYPDNKILGVVLLQKDWSPERTNLGVITNRNIQAIVVNKHQDGTCEMHNELWSQEYIGGKFKGKLSQRGAGSQELREILCEKVPGGKK
jgi:hypothetical protein